jgi:hypothetical protein
MMPKFFRATLWLALLFGVIWLGVIIWWQVTHRIPTGTDIALYLFGLPIAVVLGYWALKNSLNAIKLAASNPSTGEQQNSNSEGKPLVSNEFSAKERSYSLQLIASSVIVGHGNTTAEVITAIQEGKRPELDKELVDGDGFPVFAGRVADIALDKFADEFDPPPAIAEHPLDQWPETIIRSLLMLRKVVEELTNKASTHADAQQGDKTLELSSNSSKNASLSFALRVTLVLPDTWPLEIRNWAATWFKVYLDVRKAWEAGPILVNQIGAQSSTVALALIDQLNISVNRDELKDLCIVASCDSFISQFIVDAWSDEGRLFLAKQQSGLVPGEGAAGVLLTSIKSANGFEIDTPIEIRRLASGRRDKAIDASGKISTTLIEQLTEHALMVSNVEPAKVAALVSDVDLHPRRLLELTAVTRKLETIEPTTDSIALNASCGQLGIASGLICLALGHQLAQDKSDTVLLLCTSDAHDRAALAILPINIDPLAPATSSAA